MPCLVLLAQCYEETICYPLESDIGPYPSIELGENTNYLVVVIIITDTSQNRALGARQVEAVSSARYRARGLYSEVPLRTHHAPRPLFATGELQLLPAVTWWPRWAGRVKKNRFLHHRGPRLALLLLTLWC